MQVQQQFFKEFQIIKICLQVEVEVVTRCLLFLLEIHHGPILATPSFQPKVNQLGSVLQDQITRIRDLSGTNLAGLRYLAARYSTILLNIVIKVYFLPLYYFLFWGWV